MIFLKNSNRYVVSLSVINLVLLLMYAGFVRFRIENLMQIMHKYNEPFSIAFLIKWLGHELVISLLGLISLFGLLFWRKRELFFFLTLSYFTTVLTIVVLAPSLSAMYFVKLILCLAALWIIIFKDVYAVYANKPFLKLIFLFCGVIIYTMWLILSVLYHFGNGS